MELLKAGDPANLWDTDLLLIRCYLGSMPPAKAKEAGNVVLMTIENLLLLSETPEKLFKAVETIRGYVDEWKRYYSLMLLQMVIDSPVQEQLHLYFGSCPQCVSFEMEVEAAISQHSQLQKYASAQNCDIQTLRNQYEITHQSSFTEEDQKEMEYRTACFLFQNAVNSFEEMMVGPKAQVIKACEEIMQTYVLIDVLLSRAIEAVEDAEIKKERLYKRAEILSHQFIGIGLSIDIVLHHREAQALICVLLFVGLPLSNLEGGVSCQLGGQFLVLVGGGVSCFLQSALGAPNLFVHKVHTKHIPFHSISPFVAVGRNPYFLLGGVSTLFLRLFYQ